MKYIKQFENYRVDKHYTELKKTIKESVLQVNDLMRVKTLVDIPQSLINSYVKKVKELNGSNLRSFYSDQDLAEEIVKYVTLNGLEIDKIPVNALVGGQAQAQVSVDGQAQPQAQTEAQPQAQPQTQTEAQPKAQAQPESQDQPAQAQPAKVEVQTQDEFEEPAQAQAQPAQAQAQPAQGEKEEGEEKEELPI